MKAIEATRAASTREGGEDTPLLSHFMLSELQGNICRMHIQPLRVFPLTPTQACRLKQRFADCEFKVIFSEDAYAKALGLECGMTLAALETFGRNQPEWSFFSVKQKVK
jgi:hypothetical protein